MPLEVYLLVNHEQQEAVQSESWTYVRLASDQQDAISILSDAYRHMSGLLQLVVLLSVYDNLPDSAVADLLECEENIISRLLQKADRLFDKALGHPASRERIYEMLEYKIETNPLSPDLVDHVRQNLCETLFGSS